MMIDMDRLKAKGWSDQELQRVRRAVGTNIGRQVVIVKSLDRVTYWTTLLVLTVCNFMVTLIMAPLILTLKETALYISVFMLGLLFGIVFNLIVSDIEHLESHHHLFAAVFIPVVAMVDIMIIFPVAASIGSALRIQMSYSPWTIGGVYILGFILPYILYVLNNGLPKSHK